MKRLLLSTIATLTVVSGLDDSRYQLQQFVEEPRQLRGGSSVTSGQVADVATASFSIVQAFASLFANKKKCHQLACWIGTPTEACGMAGANQAQRELMRGRNSFAVESQGPQGMWVRYWRTRFSPPDRGDIAKGNCTDGNSFVVTNCQQTGKVHC